MTELYRYAIEQTDYKRIEKLEMLTNADTLYDDVRRLVKRVMSDHSIRRWEILTELRYAELKGEAR